MQAQYKVSVTWLRSINSSQRRVSIFHLNHVAKFKWWLSLHGSGTSNKTRKLYLHFIAKVKCSRVNDFGITLSENHFKCAMGGNSSIAFDLQCGGEEEVLGNISYLWIVIQALELYNAHAMSTSIIGCFKWPNFCVWATSAVDTVSVCLSLSKHTWEKLMMDPSI